MNYKNEKQHRELKKLTLTYPLVRRHVFQACFSLLLFWRERNTPLPEIPSLLLVLLHTRLVAFLKRHKSILISLRTLKCHICSQACSCFMHWHRRLENGLRRKTLLSFSVSST